MKISELREPNSLMNDTQDGLDFFCPFCLKQLLFHENVCDNCGQEITWKDDSDV